MLTPIPEGYHLEDYDGVLTLTKRWFSFVHIITLFFSLVWNSFLFAWYATLPNLFSSTDGPEPFALIFYLFPLIHVAVGIGLFYYSICGLLNHTTITVSRDLVSVTFAPLPWKGARKWSSSDIAQFYAQERITYSRNGGRNVYYDVNAIFKNGNQMPFVKGLPHKEEALFIEKTLEERLYIRDEAVAGEVQK